MSITTIDHQINSNLLKLDLTISQLLSQKEAILNSDSNWIQEFIKHLEKKLEKNNEFSIKIGLFDGKPGSIVSDLDRCFENLYKICDSIGANLILLCRKQIHSSIYYVDECLIRRKFGSDDFQEVRVAVVGNVDSGKSTLLGVLTHCELDNGRGLARQKLFRHKHELETGRTSSIGNDILGFDSSGNVVNKPSTHGNNQQWSKICEESSKVITFIDLAGHEKYLKTTIFGMTGHCPDYTLLMIGANAGIVGMTKEHLGVTLALNIPVFVVITKIDMCPSNILQNTIGCLKRILKSPGCRKMPILVGSDEDVVISATNFVSERLCPIFQVSNVEGTNLNYLKKFLNLLNSRAPNNDSCPPEFQIDEIYSVPGVGTVVSGLSLKGIIKVNDTLLLGPDSLGNFIPVSIKSIHRKRLPVKEVKSGQTASFALKKIRKNEIRKGMVMLCPSLNPKSYWEFEGEILVLHHPTTISARYQAMVHCGSIRQTAQILSMNQECLRTGDKAKVHFRFIKNPEYLNVGMKLIFREGRTKAIGTITNLLVDAVPLAYCKLKKNS